MKKIFILLVCTVLLFSLNSCCSWMDLCYDDGPYPEYNHRHYHDGHHSPPPHSNGHHYGHRR